jgi:hypothetical protein
MLLLVEVVGFEVLDNRPEAGPVSKALRVTRRCEVLACRISNLLVPSCLVGSMIGV